MNILSPLPKLPGLRRRPGFNELEALLEILPEAALLIDIRDQRIACANSKACEFTAFTRAELSGLTLTTLFDDMDKAALCKGDENEAALTLRTRHRAKVETRVIRYKLSERGPWELITLEDMRLMRQRQAEQQRPAEMLQSINMIGLALSQENLEKALETLLEAAQKITGAVILSVYLYNPETQPQGLEMVRYIHYGSPDIFPQCLPAQDLVHLRTAYLWKSGKRSTSALHRAARAMGLSLVVSAPLGDERSVIGLVALAGDETLPSEDLLSRLKILARLITATIQLYTRLGNLETALQTQQRARAIEKASLDAVEDGLIVLSPTLQVLRLNPAAEKMLGYTNQEARGHQAEDILISAGSIPALLQMALQGLPTLKQDNLRLYRRSGQPFLARVSILPAMSQEQLEGVIVLMQDLSEQEQIQTQARQLEQRALLGEVTAIFAHEVRNPINNLSTGLQWMAFQLPPDDPNQEVIQRLQGDLERLNELMKSVLTFSRPTEYEMEAVDLGVLLERLLERLKPRLVRANVQSLLQVEPGLPPIRGNPHALEQVFNNLITNAIQAMSEGGGSLAIKAQTMRGEAERTTVQVDVADSGPGIPKELQERIFQPFFTTKSDGTGLGLAITKRIVTAHKGSIWVTSFTGGTVFHVQLPALEGS